MPTYQYACTECGQQLEAVQSFSDAPLTECPACQGRLRKLFNSVGIVFKGSGFYRTDSRNGNGAADGAKGDKADKAGKGDAAKPAAAGAGGSSSNGSSDSGTSGSAGSSAPSGSAGSSGSSGGTAKAGAGSTSSAA